MAFTFSHPVMVLPLYKSKPGMFSLFGLVLGSMIPDLNYFFNTSLSGWINRFVNANNHYSIKTLLFYYIPSAVLLYLICEYVIKFPIIIHSPDVIKGRAIAFVHNKAINSPKSFFVFLYSLISGILTHILLDQFTHPNTFISKNLLNLGKKTGILSISNYLYIFTSMAGIIILIHVLSKIKRKPIPESLKTTTVKKLVYWAVILACGVITSLLSYNQYKMMLNIFLRSNDFSILLGAMRTFTVTFISGSILGLILASVIYNCILHFGGKQTANRNASK